MKTGSNDERSFLKLITEILTELRIYIDVIREKEASHQQRALTYTQIAINGSHEIYYIMTLHLTFFDRVASMLRNDYSS